VKPLGKGFTAVFALVTQQLNHGHSVAQKLLLR
jgi:hypothetical protein